MAKWILQSITAIGVQGKEPSLQAGVVKETSVEDTAGSERMPKLGIVLGEGKGIPDGGGEQCEHRYGGKKMLEEHTR